MAANFDCILLHGPPFAGSDVYIEKHLSKDHVKICPRSIFSSNQRFGLRDIVLKVQKCLKQDQKVVVDDDNGSFAKRSAYLKLIQKKFPEKTVALVSVFPKYGQSQVLWNQEVCLNQEDVAVSCLDITSWFDPKTGKVAYITNEEPDEEEGYTIFHHKAKLENFSPFKFDIPGLLIQIESIFTKSESMLSLRQGVRDICVHWNEQNPLGRVIFIQFGNREPLEEIKILLTKLAKQLDFPFYLFHIADPAAATPFSEPPNPGILAFLQKRHCLFLHSIKTVYIYNTQDHMKMAQAAGVNCVKITQILNNAALVNGSHVITRSPVPDFLKSMEILPTPQPPPGDPTLPGMTQDRDWVNNYMKCDLPQGRQEFIFARDLETVLRYQELYCSCVSKLAHPESIYAENRDREERVDTGTNTSLNSSTRKLPSWMMGKETTPVKQSLPRTDSTSSTEGQVRQTIYVMNEEELLEVAKDVLKQTGKSEVLKNLEASFSHDEKTRNKSVQKKIETKGIKRKSPSVKRHAKVLVESESDSDCPGTSGWKPCRGSECDGLEPGTGRIGSKCAVLDDLMTETDLRRASPRKTRRGIQAKEDEQRKVQFSSPTSKLLTKFTDNTNAKKVSNLVEKDCEKSGSVKIKTRNSHTSPRETSTSVDLLKTKREDSIVFLPKSQEPHTSKDFTSTHYNSNESRKKKISSKGSTGLYETKILKSEKDSTKTKSDYNERLEVKKTENEQYSSKKPDLSVLDEIFF